MKRKRIVIATIKSWNIENAESIKDKWPEWDVTIIREKDDLKKDILEGLQPDFVFFPHWSWIIPREIYETYKCVVFHMTDLPYGRGGSPLQNLISRGIYQTKISAISVTKELDAGDIYCKEEIDISEGNADEIFRRVSNIVFDKMMPYIVEADPVPAKQIGAVTVFQRRTPGMSRIPDGLTQRQIYDHIRMLDGEGYPSAYIETQGRKIVLRNAHMVDDHVIAEARFE